MPSWKGPEEWSVESPFHLASEEERADVARIVRAAMEQVLIRCLRHWQENWERNSGEVLREMRSLDLNTGEVSRE